MNVSNETGIRVTDVELQLSRSNGEMKAFGCVKIEDGCGIGFHLTDVRLCDGPRGWYVVMPNEAKMNKCSKCPGKNQPKANYCNWCGHPLVPEQRTKFFDLVAPINSASRDMICAAMVKAYDDLILVS